MLSRVEATKEEIVNELFPVYADILTFVRQHIPDCAWNGHELVFPEA